MLFPAPAYYVSEAAVRDAIRRRSMSSVLSVEDGDRLDLRMLTDEPFDRSRFARRQTEHLFGAGVRVSTPEDTILMKLSWGVRAGGGEKQFTDALEEA